MKKYFLLLALLLIAALAAVGLHPEVLDGYKKGMYAKEVSTSTGFFNDKVKTPLLAALKGGPDKGMQSGGLTDEEKAALAGGTDPENGTDPDNTGNGNSGVVKNGTDKPEVKDPDDGADTTAATNPKDGGSDPKDPKQKDPDTATAKTGTDNDKPGTASTKDPDTTDSTDGGGKSEPGKTGGPATVADGGADTPDNGGKAAPDGDPVKYLYDEFIAAGGVEFTGYSGIKTQNCWFNDIGGHFTMPKGSPEGGTLEVIIVTEELDCKDGVFTKVCRGEFLDIDDYPEATFKSVSIKPIEGDNKYRVIGKLQIKDKVEPCGFDAVIIQDEDEETATITAEFKLDRQKFGLDYNGAGNYAISDEFSLKLELTGETE